ncbi:FtsK/SpoIIIE family DNA translocase [Ilumatobacter nonamiensis]|uniref:FtsK/SpoIIIE family DNA translocase n=1 Tax=Ilumatobacter nonamiensis TaxID=467093 RepID=UPI00034D756C|nr:DNA translocase FtsK [Ilumatobacter nonamiensis]
MNTWGPSGKKSSKSSGKRSTRVDPASKSARTSRSSGRGALRDATPEQIDRDADEGSSHHRNDELVGLGLIGAAVLLALAIYLDLAGPIGRGVETAVGWVVGLGRFVIPIVLGLVGVAFVRRGRSASPVRVAIAWAVITIATLGLVHLIRRDPAAEGYDRYSEWGGWIGALADPLAGGIGTAGAVLLLVVAIVASLTVITQTSLRTMAEQTGGFLNSMVRPLGRAARSGLDNITTLSSDRDDSTQLDATTVFDQEDLDGTAPVTGEALPPPTGSPSLYDFESDGDAPPGVKPKRKRSPKMSTGSAGKAATGDGAAVGDWTLPSMKLLLQPGVQKVDRKAIEQRGLTLQESLASHNVETELIGMTVGPTVTRYELELGLGVKVSKVTNLQKDIAYAMAATDVRILAPIPGRSAIGVEVPNHQRQLVALGDLLTSPEAVKATNPLEVAVGKDIAGKTVMLDLAATPHMLIAGATGAGKSSGINCIITSLLMRTTPDDVRLILIDPKQVEMGQYARLPHLLTQPVTNPKKAANALGWAVKEMERRYDVLSEVGYRDIGGYNRGFAAGKIEDPPGTDPDGPPVYEHMPYIVVVVDELNDLMMVAARDVEESITRIAQKARAVGIHLIVATQRPSVNVITGVIKANIPARMAFAVSSLTDSRVILDQPGADKLVGKGDMLLLPGNSSVANRIQGAFITEEEVREVVSHWKAQAPEVVTSAEIEDGGDGASPPSAMSSPALTPPSPSMGGAPLDVTSDANAFSAGEEDEDTAMMKQAMELVVRSQLGSTSMLQRKLKVGFARAGRIMDLLEQRGVVGPSEGSKARAVLMTVEEFELLQQSGQL